MAPSECMISPTNTTTCLENPEVSTILHHLSIQPLAGVMLVGRNTSKFMSTLASLGEYFPNISLTYSQGYFMHVVDSPREPSTLPVFVSNKYDNENLGLSKRSILVVQFTNERRTAAPSNRRKRRAPENELNEDEEQVVDNDTSASVVDPVAEEEPQPQDGQAVEAEQEAQ